MKKDMLKVKQKVQRKVYNSFPQKRELNREMKLPLVTKPKQQDYFGKTQLANQSRCKTEKGNPLQDKNAKRGPPI